MYPFTHISFYPASSIRSMSFYSSSHHFLCCKDPNSNPLTHTSPPFFSSVRNISIKLYLDDANDAGTMFSKSFAFPLEEFLRDPAYAYSMFADVPWPYEELEIAISGIMDFVDRFANEPSNINSLITSVVVRGKAVTPISSNDKKVNWKLVKFRVEDAKLAEEKCAICLGKFSGGATAAKLSCGHVYDDKCIMKWLKTRNTCPMCRTVVPVQQ